MSAPPLLPATAYEECGRCKHYPAYHREPGDSRQHPCRAWDPDGPDFECACAGWQDKPAAPPPPPAQEPPTPW